MAEFKGFWRNRGPSWRMYEQHVRPSELETTDPKLLELLKRYGSMFDEEWYYWIAKTGKWIRRMPIELCRDTANAKQHHWFEKPRRYEPNRKLEDYATLES